MNRFDSVTNLYESYLSNSSIDVYAMGIGLNNSTPVSQITSSNDLPWVKEADNCTVWSDWGAENRDLFIMGKNNQIIEKINITSGLDATYVKYIIENL